MDPVTAVVLVLIVLLAMLAARAPIAFALLSSGFLGVVLLQDWSVAASTIARTAFTAPSNYVLIIIPMFIAMGVFASRGSIATDGFAIAARIMRRVPGGLAIATVLACAGFSAICGSSVATVVALGPVTTREMKAHGYDPVVAAGVIGAAGTLGVLIPPSIVLVIYGILTGESVGQLLLAGVIPAILTAAAYAVALVVRARRQGHLMGARSPRPVETPPIEAQPTARIPYVSLGKLTLIFAVVVGGIYTGTFSATEAAAIGAALALAFYVAELCRRPRGGRFRDVASAFDETGRLTAMAFALLIGSSVFTYFLVVAQVPSGLSNWIAGIDLPGLIMVALLLLAFIPLGMFLDPLSTMLIAVPLTYPVVSDLGYDGIWYGILVVKMIEVGLVTPPLGINAFVIAGAVEDVSVANAFRGILWFLPVDIAVIGIIFAFPGIVTWLPSMAGT